MWNLKEENPKSINVIHSEDETRNITALTEQECIPVGCIPPACEPCSRVDLKEENTQRIDVIHSEDETRNTTELTEIR